MNSKKLTTAQLAAVLRDMANSIEAHDSFNGSMEYHATEEAGFFDVIAVYAVGNSEGQGGYRIVEGDKSK